MLEVALDSNDLGSRWLFSPVTALIVVFTNEALISFDVWSFWT